MFNYTFLNSPLCHKAPEYNPEPQPFKHQLPPDSELPLISKHKGINFEETINQMKTIEEKNYELAALLTQKESERSKITKKYTELLMMYEEAKSNQMPVGTEQQIQEIMNENRMLCEKIGIVEKQIMESEKELSKKSKIFEEKNEASRKLLEKLNENITKREEKFQHELHESQAQVQSKNQHINLLKQQLETIQEEYQTLLNSHNDKEDQLTKLMQLSDRDRSAYSENVSTIEYKFHTSNVKMNEDIGEHLQMIEDNKRKYEDKINEYVEREKESNDKIIEFEEIMTKLEESNKRIDKQNTQLKEENFSIKTFAAKLQTEIEELMNNLENKELQLKELEGECRLLEVQHNEMMVKLKIKSEEITDLEEKNKIVSREAEKIKVRFVEFEQKHEEIEAENEGLKDKISEFQIEIERTKDLLKMKVEHNTEIEIQLQESQRQSEFHIKKSSEIQRENEELNTKIKRCHAKIESLEELLINYKNEKVNARKEMESQWKELTEFYENEIGKLNVKIMELQSRGSLKESSSVGFFGGLGKETENF